MTKASSLASAVEETCGAGSGDTCMGGSQWSPVEHWACLTVPAAAQDKVHTVLPAREARLHFGMQGSDPRGPGHRDAPDHLHGFFVTRHSINIWHGSKPQVNRDRLIKWDIPGAQS